jgi:outer membrane protein
MRKIIYIFLIALSVNSLNAQEKLDIKSAINIALENNYGIKMANNQVKQAKNSAQVGNAGLLPSLKATASSNYTDNEVETQAGKVNQRNTNNSAGLNLSYVLFNGFGRIYNFDKLKTIAEGSEYQARNIIENLLLQVINVYYNSAAAYENYTRAEEMLSISKERLQRAEAKTAGGAGSSLDVLNAKVDFNKDSVNYINSRKKYNDFKRNLNALLGRDISTKFDIAPGVISFQDFNLTDLKVQLLENNADYLIEANKVKQSKLDLKIVKSAAAPVISLNSSYGYNTMNKDFKMSMSDPNAQLSAGINLSYNIFDGKKQRIKKKNAKIALENSKLSLEEKKLNLCRDLENAWAAYDNSLVVLKTEKSNLKSAELNFLQSKEYFNLGQITSTRFREAQLNLLTAKNNITSAMYTAKLAEAELLRLSGMLLSQGK